MRSKLISHGNGISGATAGIPFPIPSDGLEAIWNHIARYRGDQIRTTTNQTTPVISGDYNLIKRTKNLYFIYGRNGLSNQDLDNTIFYYKYVITSPSKLVRTSLAVQETLDQILSIRKAWRFA